MLPAPINATFNSPAFRNQEIKDPFSDVLNTTDQTFSRHHIRAIDIGAVDYYSINHILHATLWLTPSARVDQSPFAEKIEYGMLIDADFSNKTGFGGIDYKVELTWNNQSKQWTQILERWSPFGSTLVLENKTMYQGYGVGVIRFSANLEDMLSPEKYKVLFYADERRGGSSLIDYASWVAAPPPQLAISSQQNFLTIRPGETKNIQLNLTATSGFEPLVRMVIPDI